jgi:tRNA-dihydrouridine synthase B
MERIISAVIRSVKTPITVKTRIGWDSESIRILDVARMIEQTGAAGLTIHCRTRSQAHKGEPDFSWIPKIKAVCSIPIIANGSLDTPEKIENAFKDLGCDGVMIGRGAIDNPWIFQQVKDFRKTGASISSPAVEERFRVLLEHLQLSTACKGERTGVIEFRKHYTGYLKGLYGASKVRQEMMQYVELEPARQRILQYQSDLLSQSIVQAGTGTFEGS